jgi:hypothetical protein
MGIHPLPSMKVYRSEDENFHIERIARIMTLKRFLFILRHLHLNDNTKMPNRGTNGYDKLYKLRSLIDHIKNTLQTVYQPSRNLSIDESMIGNKGVGNGRRGPQFINLCVGLMGKGKVLKPNVLPSSADVKLFSQFIMKEARECF